MPTKSVFIIGDVRGTDDERPQAPWKGKLAAHAAELESQGCEVHLSLSNTESREGVGLAACRKSVGELARADEIHLFYRPDSQETHFDMGASFALGKPIRVIECPPYGAGKSYPRMAHEWQDAGVGAFTLAGGSPADKSVFIIGAVRGRDEEWRKTMEGHVASLEGGGWGVHLPHRNTNQAGTGINICRTNVGAIANASEVHLFYGPDSQGSHFDMGASFALGKRLSVIQGAEEGRESSYSRLAGEWQAAGAGMTDFSKESGIAKAVRLPSETPSPAAQETVAGPTVR